MPSRERLHSNIQKLLGLALSANNYAMQHGVKATLRRALVFFSKSTKISSLSIESRSFYSSRKKSLEKWSDFDRRKNPDLSPVGVYKVKSGESYTTLVTDSIGRKSLFGGVGTALILGTLIANQRNQPLRIITRTETACADDYRDLLEAYDLKLDNELVLSFNSRSNGALNIPLAPQDLFITTSWWTTYSCLQRINPKSILYLIQEDERSFYPLGDLYLECERIMHNVDIRFAVNSRLLWEHLEVCGFHNIKNNGNWFEPNFKRFAKLNRSHQSTRKNRFFFYSRPSNPRNLFRTGINTINQALISKTLDPSEWEVFLVGSSIDAFAFDDGTIPKIVTGLSWTEYLDFLSSIDIGMSLMATPHPSYPPLDLASAGAIVITNKHGKKENLDEYSKNIICCDPTEEDLLQGIEKALRLINMPEQVASNFAGSSMVSSWQECLFEVVKANS
jgi:hypothetical protein